ncbi:GerMN domain-containing protein [Alkalihalobacterium bogoriense]|uniref:GerMN domain-containing protein n=1 Tax=Alkalihalobacterium bogoriense TaxID=246272 RepID=UPI00047CCD2D|nr:GerMN domain-containing protein [Alkalihalobacterium bogoriense]
MKRILQLLLITMLSLFFVAACGQDEDPIDSNETTNGIDTEQNGDIIENEPVEEDELIEEEPNENTTETDEQEVVEETVSSHSVWLVFSDQDVMDMYRIPVTVEATQSELYIKTFEAWIEGPKEEGLVSLLPDNVSVQSVTIENNIPHVSFSKELLNANLGSGTEAMLLDQIALIMEQFGYNQTQILVDGEISPSLFGHVSTDTPIQVDSIETYQQWDE